MSQILTADISAALAPRFEVTEDNRVIDTDAESYNPTPALTPASAALVARAANAADSLMRCTGSREVSQEDSGYRVTVTRSHFYVTEVAA